MENFWRICSTTLKQELTPQQFSTWIKPLAPLDYNNGLLRIIAPNRFKLDWVKIHFSNRITNLASEYWCAHIEVSFVLNTYVNIIKQSAMSSSIVQISINKRITHSQNILKDLVLEKTSTNLKKELSTINHILTFENLVTGKANQLARAAATHVANNLGISYNPLFLYGGVGLGKTHLIHAIRNQVLLDNSALKMHYIDAKQYVHNIATPYQYKRFEDFKQYYHSLDLLLIDDIQFFGGKNRTQEEFFYTFEALIAAKRQVIITSNVYPQEIHGIDHRLISRFNSGLIVALEPPELEMRMAILIKKATLESIKLSDDVAFFIAQHLQSNIRELEGALRKILAYAYFYSTKITIDVAKIALKDLLLIHNKQISIKNIQKTVADFFHIKVTEMYSKKRPANIARPRQIAMYLAKELTQKSLLEIGNLFGGRDHSTVLYAVRKIAKDRTKNQKCNQELHMIEKSLKMNKC